MDYSQDILKEIENYAQALTPISDIALLLSLDCAQLRAEIRDYRSEASLAYRRGKARCLFTLRQNEIELAEAGSPQASISVQRYHQLMEDDESL